MKRQFSIYGALAAIALFWGMLTGCEADDTPGGSSSGEVVPVTISLQMDEVDQLTKAVDEDAINTLDVYIYNDNGTTVEKHLTETDFGDDLRAETELTVGQKTIRAVANAGENYTSSFDACTWITTHDEMPMSTTKDTTWTVSSSQSVYEVRLNRMVAKMNVKIVDERANNADNVSSVTISDLMARTTNLYREGYGKVSLPTDVSDWTWETPTFSSSEANSGDFYLHENSGTFPVSVKVGNDTREGSFTKTIPRNHIFPLVIHLTDYSLQIDITYHLEAIGTITEDQSASYNNEVLLPEGCTYEITVTPKKNMTGGWNDGATWTWTEPEFELSNSSITFDGTPSWPNNNPLEAISTFTFTGKISALCQENDKVEFLITLNDKTMIKDYPLIITTRKLGNEELTKSYSVSAETEAVHIDL